MRDPQNDDSQFGGLSVVKGNQIVKASFSVAEVARLWTGEEQILQSLARLATKND